MKEWQKNISSGQETNAQWRNITMTEAKKNTSELLSVTGLSEELRLNNYTIAARDINIVLEKIGWQLKTNGWTITDKGLERNGKQATHSDSGRNYILWPKNILEDADFLNAIANYSTGEKKTADILNPERSGFREKYRESAHIRATDGHWVRSKAEKIIDNWLYINGIAHAYERRLPVEEVIYCDFYIPKGNIYLEYWGLEEKKQYARRKKAKQDIYQKYNLNLIELSESDVQKLDDILPQKLLKFGVTIT